jgi:hypothetical protein
MTTNTIVPIGGARRHAVFQGSMSLARVARSALFMSAIACEDSEAGTQAAANSARVTVQPGRTVVTAIERFVVHDGDVDQESDAPESETVTTLPIVGRKAETTPELELARSYLEDHLRRVPGFVSALLLNGQHGELAVYSQWTAKEPWPTALPAEWSVTPALVDSQAELVDARTYVVDFTAPGESSQFSELTTGSAHFGVFTMEPEVQEQLLERARTHAPTSIGTPGLVAINFHRSLDGQRVINLGAWTDFKGFTKLLERPGFREGQDKYWDGLAGFRNVFFDVANIVTAP